MFATTCLKMKVINIQIKMYKTKSRKRMVKSNQINSKVIFKERKYYIIQKTTKGEKYIKKKRGK